MSTGGINAPRCQGRSIRTRETRAPRNYRPLPPVLLRGMNEKWFQDGAAEGRLRRVKRERPPASSSWMRSFVVSALVLLVAVTAVVPHTHGLGGGLVRLAGADPSITPSSASARQERPCAACARQQDQGVAPAMRQVAVPHVQPAMLAPAAIVPVTSGQGPNVWLRGPPSAMSVC